MKYDIKSHPYFDEFVDPVSGIKSYVLNTHVGDIERHFYYINPSVTHDGKNLWYLAATYPAQAMHLVRVSLDSDNPPVTTYPQTAGLYMSSPLISPDSQGVYFLMHDHVYYMDLDGNMKVTIPRPDEYINKRYVTHMATHLTLSANGETMLLDSLIGDSAVVGFGNIKTGEYKPVFETQSMFSHGQFSYHDPELFIIAEDWRNSHFTGQYFCYNLRTWIMNTTQTVFRPITPDIRYNHTGYPSHEWWAQDGTICWVDYEKGVHELSLDDFVAHNIWQRSLCHAHCDSTRTYFCADQSPYYWDKEPCKLLFFNRKTGEEIEIASGMPFYHFERGWYHTDPHPQFTPDDSAILYTTSHTDSAKCTIALCPTDQLIK